MPAAMDKTLYMSDAYRHDDENEHKMKVMGLTSFREVLYNSKEHIREAIFGTEVTKIGEEYAFENCVNLRKVVIPEGVTEIPAYCFKGCTALKTVKIPRSLTRIGNEAFADCQNLDKIDVSFVQNVAYNAFKNVPSMIEKEEDDDNGEITDEKLAQPLTFTALENWSSVYCGYSRWDIDNSAPVDCDSLDDIMSLQISRDGVNWEHWDGSGIDLDSVGDKVFVKADGENPNGPVYYDNGVQSSIYFFGNGKLKISGNIATLCKEDGKTDHAFDYSYMFSGNDCFVDASALLLPHLDLTDATFCYGGMFSDCYNLIAAPRLPAVVLEAGCYVAMFAGCESLTTAPELPATQLAEGCYNCMFGPTSSHVAPDIDASSIVVDSSYDPNVHGNMFNQW